MKRGPIIFGVVAVASIAAALLIFTASAKTAEKETVAAAAKKEAAEAEATVEDVNKQIRKTESARNATGAACKIELEEGMPGKLAKTEGNVKDIIQCMNSKGFKHYGKNENVARKLLGMKPAWNGGNNLVP